MMIHLSKALQTWGTSEFNQELKCEIESLENDQLPLQQGLAVSSVVVDRKPTAMILNTTDNDHFIRVKVGLLYAGIIAGCSCTDDPTPMSENTEYCVVQLEINKNTAETTVMLLAE